MTTIVDEYLDTSTDMEDVFPCKGCGEILEEGKAFELAGNRWHLDCFRCNTCGTLLDSDANLLLLGDGSLICNNCTYSCSACGNKIEDLAILTGDQAFCSTCFRCRNCKRKIENLRYARTSQGIFCMGCHESLMARRRKKSKAAAAAKTREKEGSPMITEKSLPALPPNVIPNNAFSNDRVDPESDTPTELSPRPQPTHRHTGSSSHSNTRAARSPERQAKPLEGLGLSSHPFRPNRNSTIAANDSSGDDGFFIPVALDPSPGPSSTPRSGSDIQLKKDSFSNSRPSLAEKRTESQSSTPHIAFQDKGRQPSEPEVGSLGRKLSKSSKQDQRQSTNSLEDKAPTLPARAMAPPDEFKLQDAPKNKRLVTTGSTSSQSSAQQDPAPKQPTSATSSRYEKEGLPSSETWAVNENAPVRSSQDSDRRGSVESGRRPSGSKIARKEVGVTTKSAIARSATADDATSLTRAPPRPGLTDNKHPSDNFMQPRVAPPPPLSQSQPAMLDNNGAAPLDQSSPKTSPKLPRWSNGGDFTMDEDMARILGSDDSAANILRRASNLARRGPAHGRTNSVESTHPPSRASHTRSVSESTRHVGSPRWTKTTTEERNGVSGDLASPASVSSTDDAAFLKRQLRTSEQRVADLERQFNSESDLKIINKKLIEKRKTVSVLDSQTEIMIRQLEVLAGYVERAKDTNQPIDPRELEDSAIKDFVQKLDRVKISMSAAIEQLHEEREQAMTERDQALADRDRALMEFEQLSSKNAQLADMNNDLTHQIQGRFRNQVSTDGRSSNGLGIYGDKGGSSTHLDSASMTTGTTLVHGDDDTIVEGPTVVQVMKPQVKKFNWKKGSKTMAQNVSKGLNRAVVAFQNDRGERIPHPGHPGLAGNDIGVPYNSTVVAAEPPLVVNAGSQARQMDRAEHRRFFGGNKKQPMTKSATGGAVLTSSDVVEAPSTLFGSDLSERADYERRQIPAVVTRCIEEVELRGMDQEGIYRKTGGNSQVNMIKDGFDKNENFDISDPDMDITAVTSVLKQYFRKLPNPLLTFEVYERILESNAIADEAERCDHLRKTFAAMPEKHRDCLEFLMFHLDRVAQRQGENLMTPKNLAVVFAPTIMRDRSIEKEMTDMHAKNLAVQFVIENSRTIFAEA